MSKTVTSKSHVDDAKGGHSKQSQRPEPAHQYAGQRTSLDVDEAKQRTSKKKPEPAHLTHFHDLKGEHEETLRAGAFPNRKHPGDAKEVPGGAAKARRAGPHGHQVDTNGDNDATPKKRHVARIG